MATDLTKKGRKMKLINRLSDQHIAVQHNLFQRGATINNKDLHIINVRGSVLVYEQQITPLLRQLKQRFLRIIH